MLSFGKGAPEKETLRKFEEEFNQGSSVCSAGKKKNQKGDSEKKGGMALAK